METLHVGTFRVETEGARLRVTPSGALDRLLPCRRRARLELIGPSQLGAIAVEKRRLRGTEVKRPWMARPWLVRVTGPDGRPLCTPLGFRSEGEAERLARTLEEFRASAA